MSGRESVEDLHRQVREEYEAAAASRDQSRVDAAVEEARAGAIESAQAGGAS